MVKKYVLFALTFVLLLKVNPLKSQSIQRFSNDSIRFATEMEYFLKQFVDKENKQMMEEFLLSFRANWSEGVFSNEERREVYSTCNLMLKKKMQAVPYFIDYLDAVVYFAKTGKPIDEYVAWHKALEKVIEKEHISKYSEFLVNTALLLRDNIVYQSPTTIWKASNANFIFEYDKKPFITFKSLDLICSAKRDSIVILKTAGVYYPIEKIWKGKGGTVTWERAGFKPDDVYALLNNYKIEMKYSHYKADTVTFFNKNNFQKPLTGSFEDKVMATENEERETYPRFSSFNKRIQIKDLFKDIDYLGGYNLYGAKFYGTGTDKERAICTFYKNNKKFIVTRAYNYIIRDNQISSDAVDFSLYFQTDSIYHPYVELKFLNDKNELTLSRRDEGLYKSPFYNSYHKLDMYFESLIWQVGSDNLEFAMSKSFTKNAKSTFESSNYYSEFRFEQFQGLDQRNPLYLIREYSRKIKSDTITVAGLAGYLTVADHQAVGILINMAGLGWVSYNEKNKTAVLKEKYHFNLSAKGGKTDYDVISFNSETHNLSNGSLNLDSFDLKLNGVKSIELSGAQAVYIFPYDEEITVKKNRDFAFEGHIKSGLFDFYGKDFYFDYNNFKIKLNNTDSMKFKIPTQETDDIGNAELAQVRTALEDVNGELFIDQPHNKSGRIKVPHYPIFKSDQNTSSFVYYDKRFIQKGAYDRSRFYFQVKPFTIDSLDNTSTSGISFNGTFVSGGIFPDFDDSLMVQPDMSLGFVRYTSGDGYSVYGGKGRYYNKIHLSYEGLKGDGSLKYLTSTGQSNEFIFFLDSLNAHLTNYEVKEQIATVQYPPVLGKDVYMHWMPYKDVMSVYKKETPLDFYAGKAAFHGRMDYTPQLMSGDGTMAFYNSKLKSKFFKYKEHEFSADTSDFSLNALNSEELAITTTNYKSYIDFNKEFGQFNSNGGVAKIDFPINQYISFMDEFDWYMDKGDIELRNTKFTNLARLETLSLSELIDEDLSGSDFVSVHPMQDSLRFFSSLAHYNIGENIIQAENVKIIKVADAAVYPDSGRVEILKRAEMKTLRFAQVLADTATRYHRFYDGNINIISKRKYYGNAKYDYVDENDELKPIYFDNVNVDDSLYRTYAKGYIADISDFALSPYFDFHGNVRLDAPKKFLNFDGGVKISHDCQAMEKNWFYFNTDINPDTIQIPVPQQPTLYNKDRTKTFAGIYIAKDTTDVLSAFFSPKHSFSDTAIVTSQGLLIYHNPTDEYRIASLNKLNNRDSLPGNYFSLNTSKCNTYGEGIMGLGVDFGQVKYGTIGNIRHYTQGDSIRMRIMLWFDFFFNDKALKVMRDDFENYQNLKGVDYSSFWFRKSLGEVVGAEKSDELISEMELYGSYRRLPQQLEHNIVLTDVSFIWSKENQAYISQGKIGVSNLGGSIINKYLNGYVELKKRKHGGHELSIYLQASNENWYFFNYRNNFMQAISSNAEFNTAVTETKEEDRIMKVEKGQQTYNFYISTERKKDDFVKKMKGL